MPSVYFLHSDKDQRWYIGCTNLAVQMRFDAHCNGKVISTRHRRPLRLAYFENAETFNLARKREWLLKHPAGFIEKKRIVEFLLKKREIWPLEGPIDIDE